MAPPGELRGKGAAWCICSVKSCVIHAERFRSGVINLRRYTNGTPLPFYLFTIIVNSAIEIVKMQSVYTEELMKIRMRHHDVIRVRSMTSYE